MDACLDTHSIVLYQENVCVDRIAWRQAIMGAFAPKASPPPPLVASNSEDEDDDDGDDDDASDNENASSSGTDEMSI